MASHKSLKMSKKTTSTGKQDFQIAFRAMKNSATPKPDTLRSITANNGSLQHPLAKYNVNGKLTCKLCNLQISNDKLWPVHLKSKTHSAMEKRLKQLSDKDGKRDRKCDVIHQSNGTLYSGAKTEELVSDATSTPPTPTTTTTSSRSINASSSSSSGSNVQNNTKPLKSILKNRIHSPPPIIAKKAKFTYNEDTNNSNSNPNNTTDNINMDDSSSMLPMDFFDTANDTTTTTTTIQPEYSHVLANSESVESSSNIGAAQQSSTLATDTSTDQLSSSFTNNQEGLPEGFFDDPFKDAKIRGVETLEETQEREWEEFKRSIQSEDIVSDELVAEREQGEQIDRDYSQVFEQSQCYFRAESLRAKQESLWLMKTQNEGDEIDTATATSNYTDLNSDMQIDSHATECTDTSTPMVVDECRNNLVETDVATSVEGNSETNENSDDDNDNYSDTDFNWRAQHL